MAMQHHDRGICLHWHAQRSGRNCAVDDAVVRYAGGRVQENRKLTLAVRCCRLNQEDDHVVQLHAPSHSRSVHGNLTTPQSMATGQHLRVSCFNVTQCAITCATNEVQCDTAWRSPVCLPRTALSARRTRARTIYVVLGVINQRQLAALRHVFSLLRGLDRCLRSEPSDRFLICATGECR